MWILVCLMIVVTDIVMSENALRNEIVTLQVAENARTDIYPCLFLLIFSGYSLELQ